MSPVLTQRVNLPGGQDRLRQLILYICTKNIGAKYFGRVKLNKILWKSDFSSYAIRQVPVTGRAYQRLPQGPAPKEMMPLYREMLRDGVVREEITDFGGGKIEKRPSALHQPNLALFSAEDISFVDSAITYYWAMTGTETSDDSHGAAWSTRHDGDPMPYESAFLSDRPLLPLHIQRLQRLAEQNDIRSQ
ncbi:MAG: hypothetical protein JWS10_2438 [Cypionkella sp.]|uniref:Panacea domain-containing protein n=1 Tax=Cypionkella sp. TaxID=2811411 RepID=UPI00261777BF|nr:Panacea domain-containing protein [Cypionkella sp.]MDB5659823.1 hypothetical protein [Cypionkella sp.]